MTKPTKWHVRPAKTQISLGIHLVWSESLLSTQWAAKDLSFLHADSEDSDQPGQMPRLLWVFAGRTCHFVGFVLRWFKYQQFHGWKKCLIWSYDMCKYTMKYILCVDKPQWEMYLMTRKRFRPLYLLSAWGSRAPWLSTDKSDDDLVFYISFYII